MVVLRHFNHSSKLTAQSNRERDMRMGKTRESPRAKDRVRRVKVRVSAGKAIKLWSPCLRESDRGMRETWE